MCVATVLIVAGSLECTHTVVKGSDKDNLVWLVSDPGLEAQLEDLGRTKKGNDDRDIFAGEKRIVGDGERLVLGDIVRGNLALSGTPSSAKINVSSISTRFLFEARLLVVVTKS